MKFADHRQLTIPGSEIEIAVGPALAAVRRAAEVAAARVKDPHLKSTTRAYERHWEVWGRWCDDKAIQAYPVEPDVLVIHLEWLTLEQKRAPNSVRAALTAIASLDQWARTTPTDPTPFSVRRSPIVQRWLKSWGRENPVAPQRRAGIIEPLQLHRVLAVINEPSPRCAVALHVMRATRDKAMLLLGIYGALRVSEVVALTTDCVRFADRGLEIFLPRSKTDQYGKGKSKRILPASTEGVCAVTAYRAWLTLRGEWTGPVFVAIQRNGLIEGSHLTTRTVQRLITDYARRAGLEFVSSHSMRATLGTLAAKRGHPIEAVAEHMGHSDLNTTRGYMDRAGIPDDRNPTAGLFDGG